ncbi:multidrug/Oligosaccharidyl-lipid/Polysaccharide flippase [Naematelia encephala]|uniref:Multidrug/Oligosaccharidyl-lipid/Polysaccharide flippase n=1 Tax=Naematelia encephala TaxID=71784 RepID=A0A1Y2B039_9TREE|nr:multidrug/Oligosaccharidyl-lipid/Polysaccharide flippase [Naematelia encephala]
MQFAHFSLYASTIISLSHLGTAELAAAGLESMTVTVTGILVFQGMASALDSVLPAAWTSPEPEMMGVWTQRMLAVMTVLLFPVTALWWNITPVLLHLGQDPEVVALASVYLRAVSLGLPGFALNQVMRKYFQSQNLMRAPSIVVAIVAPVNALMNSLLVWGPDWIRVGFVGAPLAQAASFNAAGLLSVLYAVVWAPRTAWAGFDRRQAFQELGVVFSLGLSGIVMISAEWWVWQVCTLVAGSMGRMPFATHSVLLNFTGLLLQFPLSIGLATSVRVGNLLGLRRKKQATLVGKVSVIASIGVSLHNRRVIGTSLPNSWLLAFRYSIARLFNSDPQVVEGVGRLAIYLAALQLAEGVAGAAFGTLRAVGKHHYGAAVNIVSFLGFAIPLALFFASAKNWGIDGMWLGMTMGVIVLGGLSLVGVSRIDWDQAVRRAQILVGEQVDAPEDPDTVYRATAHSG